LFGAESSRGPAWTSRAALFRPTVTSKRAARALTRLSSRPPLAVVPGRSDELVNSTRSGHTATPDIRPHLPVGARLFRSRTEQRAILVAAPRSRAITMISISITVEAYQPLRRPLADLVDGQVVLEYLPMEDGDCRFLASRVVSSEADNPSAFCCAAWLRQ
jgi:hypothetical protein